MQHQYNFSNNTRQSKVAILLLAYKYYKIAFRQFLAFIALLAVSLSKTSLLAIWIVLIASTIVVFIFAILAYYRFYFRIEDQELIIEKGIFKKTKLNIPFERIQTVNFEQNILLQFFEKYKVEIDTAGSAKKEFSFDALDKEIAQQLRNTILEHKEEVQYDESTIQDDYESSLRNNEMDEKLIFNLTITDLLKIGITENHLKAGAWLIAIAGYIFSTANDAGLDLEEKLEDIIVLQNINADTALIAMLFFAFVFILVLVSIIRTLLKYYDLSFVRLSHGFKIFSGLLNRKEFTAPDKKIQIIAWGDNPLKRFFGIFTLWLKQARSSDNEQNKSFSIPIKSKDHIHLILKDIYGDKISKELFRFKISKHFIYRKLLFWTFIPTFIFIFIGYLLTNYIFITIAIIYLIYRTISTIVQYKKLNYEFNDFLLKKNKGIFGNYSELIPWYKIQVVDIVQSIYQRRKKLATIYLHTASGLIKIPYVSLIQAEYLRDYALYKAESSELEWM